MQSKSTPHDRLPASDEHFWEALFAQEDTSSPYQSLETSTLWNDTNLFQHPSAVNHSPQSDQATPWELAWHVFHADECLELTVRGFNKGGLLVRWNGLQGFVPASQLVDFPQFHLESQRVEALRTWQKKQLRLKIIEVNEAQNRFILSQRAAMINTNDRDRLFDQIKPKQQLQGEVTNLTNFGAFVDLGGVEGLIHISELSWSRVLHPSDVLQPGQQVTVRVLNIDADHGRIALSLKRLKNDPWENVEQRYQIDQIVAGVVSKIVNFGVFVQLEEELEGLIHISELAEGTFLHPRNVVKVGQQIGARVLYVDGPEKRLALSLRGVSS